MLCVEEYQCFVNSTALPTHYKCQQNSIFRALFNFQVRRYQPCRRFRPLKSAIRPIISRRASWSGLGAEYSEISPGLHFGHERTSINIENIVVPCIFWSCAPLYVFFWFCTIWYGKYPNNNVPYWYVVLPKSIGAAWYKAKESELLWRYSAPCTNLVTLQGAQSGELSGSGAVSQRKWRHCRRRAFGQLLVCYSQRWASLSSSRSCFIAWIRRQHEISYAYLPYKLVFVLHSNAPDFSLYMCTEL